MGAELWVNPESLYCLPWVDPLMHSGLAKTRCEPLATVCCGIRNSTTLMEKRHTLLHFWGFLFWIPILNLMSYYKWNPLLKGSICRKTRNIPNRTPPRATRHNIWRSGNRVSGFLRKKPWVAKFRLKINMDPSWIPQPIIYKSPGTHRWTDMLTIVKFSLRLVNSEQCTHRGKLVNELPTTAIVVSAIIYGRTRTWYGWRVEPATYEAQYLGKT